MNDVFNKDVRKWVRPWNLENFDDLYNRDERFFSLIIKGLISWLNRNIFMYNKHINHFIFNTGSSYLYIESNGYEYNLSETTGEDSMYMQLPRCIIEFLDVHVQTEELSAPFSRGNYERHDGKLIRGYNAEIRRLPIEINIKLHYYLGTFNESIILMQELIDKIVFQQYFNIIYLGNVIQCSIEFPSNVSIQINKIDMSSVEPNNRNIELDLILNTNYPLINERTEIPTDVVISSFGHQIDLYNHDYESDIISKGKIMDNKIDNYDKFIKDQTNEDESNISIFDISDIDTLINKFDINDDGIIDENEIISILEQIKNDAHINNDTNNDYVIDYLDLSNIFDLINMQENVSVNYDKITNKIYITHIDTGDVKDIGLEKYKIRI